ncbi:hypothetical protein BU25DRAFT_76272 [Macroventuria anomochaeta]|uniref:Uncharacterized protein n=1 Tax=Macroventuria anomochaeta TaxID=301207 RepID=A0ACB6SDZ2_9PLEO|nr:uncharacterized protein BU25DRAFT_76272 [Macroventuria anomochaeta]KAF2632510.1 hypothetical protein BU25DRAFT_76272 [Macroventuria anomochaeta]
MFLDVPSSIIYPPPGGWPNMIPEVMDCLGKNAEVISLLRHLPFPDDQPYTARPHCLPGCRFQAWKTSVDKLKEEEADREDLLLATESKEYQFGGKIPKYCVDLTHALNISEYVMLLDIRTGLVYWMGCPEEILEACDPQPSRLVYPLEGEAEADKDRSVVVAEGEEDDTETSDDNREHETPPTSDDENDDEDDEPDDSEDDGESEDVEWGPCWPVRHFFAMLKNHFIKLNFIPYSSQRVIQIWTERYTDHEKIPEGVPEFLQSIYHKHGWPNLEVYQKEACLAELKDATGTEGTKYYNLDQYYQNREH